MTMILGPADILVCGKAPIKSSRGGGAYKPCSCLKQEHMNREAAARFLRVVRTRFSLPMGELPDMKIADFGQYLSFLLLNGRQRPSLLFPRSQRGWRDGFPILSRLGRRQRWEFASTMASFKRGLRPNICLAHSNSSGYASWSSNACRSEPPVSSPDYLAFVRKVTRRVFRFGWDDTYDSFCRSFVPSSSSRFDRGVSAIDWWRSRCSWKKFQSYLRGRECEHLQGAKLRYKAVPAVGKVRHMGLPTSDWDLLGPLHKTMYQYIASKEWILKGPPTAGRISSVCTGEWQTSIDLVAATDGLCQDVARAILEVAMSKASSVPGRIGLMAIEYQTPTCRGLEVNHGQNMGTYLSFPLLCLQSYIAARWATRNDGSSVSILVNGDDTVISCSRPIESSDYPPGFQINDTKTARQRNFVEVNSTQFIRQNERWRKVCVLRRGAFYSDAAGIRHFASVCSDAGSSWQSALCRHKRYFGKLLPSVLGLNVSIPVVYRTDQLISLGRHYEAVMASASPDSRFDLLASEPCSGDRLAFCVDLFEGGRETREVPDFDFDTMVLSRENYRYRLSYQPYRSRYEKEKKKREKLYCYSQLYPAVEESLGTPGFLV
jgi:hypothetical protein